MAGEPERVPMISKFRKEDLNYAISGLHPAEGMFSAYNFRIELKGDFARRLMGIELPEKENINLNKRLTEVLQRIFPERKMWMTGINHPLGFYGKSCLLMQCCVPGDATDLGIDGSDQDKLVKKDIVLYLPHNVDSIKQAYGLLSLWTLWYEIILSKVWKE